jgi:hypothetical protein
MLARNRIEDTKISFYLIVSVPVYTRLVSPVISVIVTVTRIYLWLKDNSIKILFYVLPLNFTWRRRLQPCAVISDNVLMVELGVELHLSHHFLLGCLWAGQRDALYRVVNVVDFVLRFKDDTKSAPTETLGRFYLLEPSRWCPYNSPPYNSPPSHLATLTSRHHYISPVQNYYFYIQYINIT